VHRRVLGVLTCLAAVAALVSCGTAAGEDAQPAATPRAQEPDPAPVLPDGVTSRVLQLTDPSRVTDPTPQDAGDDAQPGRSLPTTLYYPTTGTGPFPVVVFSHGMDSLPAGYGYLLSAWAEAGFVVAAPQFPLTSAGSALVQQDIAQQPADVSFVLTQVLALNTTAGDELAGRLDPARVAVTGHSAGAITTIGLLGTCCTDPRITAAVLLAGSPLGFGTAYAQPGVPTLFLHGTADGTLPIAGGRTAYEAAPSPSAFVELIGGTHTEPYANPSTDLFPVVAAVTTDFLRWALDGDAAALAALRSDADRAGLARLAGDRLPT
jgi:dienelactone hydrolase